MNAQQTLMLQLTQAVNHWANQCVAARAVIDKPPQLSEALQAVAKALNDRQNVVDERVVST